MIFTAGRFASPSMVLTEDVPYRRLSTGPARPVDQAQQTQRLLSSSRAPWSSPNDSVFYLSLFENLKLLERLQPRRLGTSIIIDDGCSAFGSSLRPARNKASCRGTSTGPVRFGNGLASNKCGAESLPIRVGSLALPANTSSYQLATRC